MTTSPGVEQQQETLCLQVGVRIRDSSGASCSSVLLKFGLRETSGNEMRRRHFRQEASPDVVLLSRWFARTWTRLCQPSEWRRYQEQLESASLVQLQERSGDTGENSEEEENDWTEEAYEKEMFLKRESERQRVRLKRLLQLLFLACVITACVLVSTGAFILAHFAADCRLPPLHLHEQLESPLLPALHVSSTGAVVLRTNSTVDSFTENKVFFRMFHFSTETDRLAKTISFVNSSGVSLSVAEAGGLSKNYLGGHLCSGTDVDIVLPASAVLKILSLSSNILGTVSVGLGPLSALVPFFETVEIVSVQGVRVHAINASFITVRSGVGNVLISDLHLQGDAPRIEILSRGGSVTLNLTGSGFSGLFEIHVGYGDMEIPGFILCTSVPCPTMSYTKSEDLVSGQGSIFQGKLGDGNGRLKVFALTGTDVALTLT